MNAVGFFNFLVHTFSLSLMELGSINKFYQYLVVDILLN